MTFRGEVAASAARVDLEPAEVDLSFARDGRAALTAGRRPASGEDEEARDSVEEVRDRAFDCAFDCARVALRARCGV
jgi:hypothetical protein